MGYFEIFLEIQVKKAKMHKMYKNSFHLDFWKYNYLFYAESLKYILDDSGNGYIDYILWATRENYA